MLDNVHAQLQQAYALIKQGQREDALQILRPILSRQPNLAEAWWLAAHAASTDKDASYAYNKVLTLKPDYAPARQMLAKQQLNDAAVLLYNKQKPEALAQIKSLVEHQPDNADAWWLMANAAVSTIDAVLACQNVLALQPDHAEARARLIELQQQSAQSLAEKYHKKDAVPRERKTRWWRVFGLIGIIIMILTGGLIGIYATGRTFGLPLGKLFNVSHQLGTLAEKPVTEAGTLIEGATHEYHFHTMHNSTQIMVLVEFPAGTGNTSKYMKLVGPENKVIPLGNAIGQGSSFAQVMATLPDTGDYDLILTGTAGGGQGAYVMELAAVSDYSESDRFGLNQP